MPLPNYYSIDYLKVLERTFLVYKLCIYEDGNVLGLKIDHNLFHPVKHIPPTNPTNYINISLLEGYLFATCISMQNV